MNQFQRKLLEALVRIAKALEASVPACGLLVQWDEKDKSWVLPCALSRGHEGDCKA